jgi:exodeoxyribonuclease VII small subunit
MKEEFKYSDAMTELESIVKKMEQGEMDIDSLAKNLSRAKQLIEQCKTHLTKVDSEVNKILES